MEPVVATGRNPLQIARAQKARTQAKTVAARWDHLPRRAHGKEGVDGLSPSAGFSEWPAKRGLFFLTARRVLVLGRPWKASWKIQLLEPLPRAGAPHRAQPGDRANPRSARPPMIRSPERPCKASHGTVAGSRPSPPRPEPQPLKTKRRTLPAPNGERFIAMGSRRHQLRRSHNRITFGQGCCRLLG
jgi:hypothetical protein